MTKDGLDLLTVVMHELGHLLGYDHSDDPDDLMAPVLATGQACGGSELEAVESRGQSRWRRPSSPSVTALASTPRMPSWAGMETTSCFRSCWSRSMKHCSARESGSAKTQARVPRHSLQRYACDLDDGFTQLAAAEEEAVVW